MINPAKARMITPTPARTNIASACWKAKRPIGRPARQPTTSRNNSPEATPRRNLGMTKIDSAVEIMTMS
jgi:hypothetical protein